MKKIKIIFLLFIVIFLVGVIGFIQYIGKSLSDTNEVQTQMTDKQVSVY